MGPTSGVPGRRRFLALGLAGVAGPWLGTRAARGGEGPDARWDADAVDPAATLDQPGWVQAVAFARDGRTLAVAGFAAGGVAPSWITTWRVGTWRRLGLIEVPGMRIHRLAFAPDGAAVVAAGLDESRLILGDLESGRVRDLVRLPGTGGMPMTPTFTPEGRYLLSGTDEEGIRIWSADSWGESRRLPGTRDGGFEAVMDPLQPWGDLGGRAYLLGRDGTLFKTHFVQPIPVDAVVPPGARYVGPPQYGFARVRGVGRPWNASRLAVGPDGRSAAFVAADTDGGAGWVATFGVDGEGNWAARARLPLDLEPHLTYALAFTPDGRALVAGGGAADGNIRRWDLATGRVLPPLAGHRSSILDLATTPDGWLASAGNADRTARVWAPRGAAR